MAKEVTIKIDQSAGQIAIADGTLFLGENAPIKFTGCTLAKGESIRLVLFAKDGTTAIADNSTDSSLLDLRTEPVKKAFHSEQVDHAFLAYAFSIDTAGAKTGTIDARGVLPVAWSPVEATSKGALDSYKGEKGDKGDLGDVDPDALVRKIDTKYVLPIPPVVWFGILKEWQHGDCVYSQLGDTDAYEFGALLDYEYNKYAGEYLWSWRYYMGWAYGFTLLEDIDNKIAGKISLTKKALEKDDTLLLDHISDLKKTANTIGETLDETTGKRIEVFKRLEDGRKGAVESLTRHSEAENPHNITPATLGTFSLSKISELIQDLGKVCSVNDIFPDEKGNVHLTAKDVNAVPARMDKPYAIDEQPIYKAPAFYTKYMGLVFGDSTITRIGDKEKNRDLPYLTAPIIRFQARSEASLYAYNGDVLTEDMTDEVYADGVGITGLQEEIASLNETLESVA